MANLLPPEEKQKLIGKRQEKIVAIWGIILIASIVCLILILLSVKFYILSESNYYIQILKQERAINETAEFSETIQNFQKYNAMLGRINFFYGQKVDFGQAFDIILKTQNSEVLKLTNFLLTRKEGNKITANISGVADSRDDLIAFKEDIVENKKILNPVFSTESWISPKNVKFSLTFDISANEEQQQK